MKKIYYFLAFIVAAATFSACNPLDKTYKQLGDIPAPTGTPQSFSLTLAAADYALLPTTNYAKTSLSFKTKDDAAASIPTILTSKYPNYANKSAANVTYAIATIKVADSLISASTSYTAVNADYVTILGTPTNPIPKYNEFTTAQAIQLVSSRNPSPVSNQEYLLTYIYYESGVTSTAVTVTDTFLYLNGAWIKCYTITPAQFTYVGNAFGDFSSSDGPLINTYLSAILKADLGVTLKAKAGDVKYVSYKYYNSKNYQRIQPLMFDGTNWVASQTLSFVKANGTWAADNTVTYTFAGADYTYVTTIPNISGVNNPDPVTNLIAHGNFSVQANSTAKWTDDQINNAIAAVLKNKYTSAVANQKFVITVSEYTGSASVNITKTFVYDGTNFKFLQ